MKWLNHNQLLHFWMVVREGGIVPAAKRLALSHSTISTQIHHLEEELGEKLFTKQGRRLVPTDVGRLVYRYADEIFMLSRELTETVQGQLGGKPQRVVVGVAESVPKIIARQILSPVRHLESPVRLVCREDRPERLFAELALHSLDLVISDSPVPPGLGLKVFHHLLGESPVAFFIGKSHAHKWRRRFPQSLDGAPFLLPFEESPLRRSLDQWFDSHQINPKIIGEFEDSALLKSFALEDEAFFAAPQAIAKELLSQYDVALVGMAEGLFERFYVITAERRLRNPAVIAISQHARRVLPADV